MAITTDGRVCTSCDNYKEAEHFRLVKTSARVILKSTCKKCEAIQQKSRPKLSTEQRRKYVLKQLYGISLEDYTSMLEEQGATCKLCGTTNPEGRGAWHVDHNHETGVVRGLLCHSCNTGIGHLKDDPDLLTKAALYIKKDGDI